MRRVRVFQTGLLADNLSHGDNLRNASALTMLK